MANRFWVGGTGAWNSSNTTSWSTTSGGGGGASVPGTSDVAIFDGSSGGGTVTVDSPNGAGVVTVQQITMGAFTGTLDFATNDNNVTLSVAFSGTGTGARTLNMGDGTWTLTATGAATLWDCSTVTNFTFNCNSSTIALTGTATANQTFAGGGLTYNTVHLNRPVVNSRQFGISFSNTFANLTITNARFIALSGGTTQTITGTFTYDGSSTSVGFLGSTTTGSTLSLSGANTVNWLTIGGITESGAGSLTANNSFDAGNNSNVTINAPSTGGGPRVIGG